MTNEGIITMKKVVLLACLVALVGCEKKETHTQEWYDQHHTERDAKVASCRDAEYASENKFDCANAINATAFPSKPPTEWDVTPAH